MTEAEWLASVNAEAMIAEVRNKGNDRIWRLFAVACVRRVEHQMRYRHSRKALEVAERFADGMATRGALRTARALAEAAAEQARRDEWEDEVRAHFSFDSVYQEIWEASVAANAVLCCVADEIDASSVPEAMRLPDLIRELFGNPFRWTCVEVIWLCRNDGIVQNLARSIYDNRTFDHLPILADALEEAGCADADLLGHLRSPGPHVRGCWALDLILAKDR